MCSASAPLIDRDAINERLNTLSASAEGYLSFERLVNNLRQKRAGTL